MVAKVGVYPALHDDERRLCGAQPLDIPSLSGNDAASRLRDIKIEDLA